MTIQGTAASDVAANATETLPRVLKTRDVIFHAPRGRVNTLLDAASPIFTLLGKLQLGEIHSLDSAVLYTEFLQQCKSFEKRAIERHYGRAYVHICRYLLCVTIDDLLIHEPYGYGESWSSHRMLAAFEKEATPADKFYAIVRRALETPSAYIDLLELAYLALSYGYRGEYREVPHGDHLRDALMVELYGQIRTIRGDYSQKLCIKQVRMPVKNAQGAQKPRSDWPHKFFMSFVTLSVIMVLFIGFTVFMDQGSHDVYQTITAPSSNPSLVGTTS